MRTKKALKQLGKAEALITTVASRYTANTPEFRQMLDSVIATIRQARGTLNNPSARPTRNAVQSGKKQSPGESEGTTSPAFDGNKTEFVRALVEDRGSNGAVPKDIADVFTARGIGRSENLIYNALSTLVKQKKLKKQDGRYFATSMESKATSVAPKKQRISPQGLKRIREANKRRWATHRAARTRQTASLSQSTKGPGRKRPIGGGKP